MAAFGAAAGQYFAAVGSGHARAETVDAFTFQIARLKSSFHGDIPSGVEMLLAFVAPFPARGREGLQHPEK